MEEVEKRKTVKVTSPKEKNKIMTALYEPNLRSIVRQANEVGVQREDIISLLKENGQYVLIYYK